MRFKKVLSNKAACCFVPRCPLIWCRKGFKGERTVKVQLQPRKVNLLHTEGGRAALQSSSFSMHWREGRAVTPTSSLLHICESFTDRKTRKENKHNNTEVYQTPVSAWSASISLYRLGISHGWSQHLEGPSSATDACTAQTHCSPGTGNPGAKTRCAV